MNIKWQPGCNIAIVTVTVPYNFCQYWHTSRWSLLKFIVGLYVGWYLQGPNDFLHHPIYRPKDLLKHGVHAYVCWGLSFPLPLFCLRVGIRASLLYLSRCRFWHSRFDCLFQSSHTPYCSFWLAGSNLLGSRMSCTRFCLTWSGDWNLKHTSAKSSIIGCLTCSSGCLTRDIPCPIDLLNKRMLSPRPILMGW